MKHSRVSPLRSLLLTALMSSLASAAYGQEAGNDASSSPPRPPSNLQAADNPMDNGEKIILTWEISPDDPDNVSTYLLYRSRTVKEIEKQIADEKKKFIDAVKTKATDGLLGEGWQDRIVDLTPEQLTNVREARSGAAGRAETTFSSTPASDPASEDNVYMQIGTAMPGEDEFVFDKLDMEEAYTFMVKAVGLDLSRSTGAVMGAGISPVRQWFDGKWDTSGGRFWLSIIMLTFCGAVIFWILRARSGKPIKVRKIAGLDAVDEAVGRATEMGRSILYVPGIQDMNDIQTIASMTVLSHVSKTAADYDAKIEVPTARSLVMTVARETMQASYLAAGKPDAYNQDLIYYVTDEQFGYVAYLSGMMVREKPAVCFYMGAFYAESLILAETGNHIGAIQIAGTAMPAQLPFFVAACDYTLIGEEYFAASAYLSGSPEELGSLKGQDVGKIIVVLLMFLGITLFTLAELTSANVGLSNIFRGMGDFLKNVILT